ncbi:MAG: metallopeptidase family protein [Chloroflexi bacterium]|jgi:predicted Zn-dependent protease with MMP-like domain|nr:metallopeptidase family protein [Chloroflexota bacterium]
MERALFERLVDEALANLPAAFRERLDNVAIVVADWPDAHTLRLAGARSPAELLGFYHGVPLSRRGSGYGLVTPDQISIYRFPILLQAEGEDAVRGLVQRVVAHEIAHHFGIDDERLRSLGAY